MDLITSTTTDECNNNRQFEESPQRPRKRKRSRRSESPSLTDRSSFVTACSQFSEESPQRPRKRSRRSESPSEDLTDRSSFVTACSQFSEESLQTTVSSSTDNHSEDDFEAKYTMMEELLGKGGFGTVLAGNRIEDNLPVAIKTIENQRFKYLSPEECINRDYTGLPREVAMLLHLRPADGETSAVVSLLDWYLVNEGLILVLERPDPCMDLKNYLKQTKNIQEDDVKILAKQLLDCLIDVLSKGVFHRDIKLQNILIETGSSVPRYRLIDFGCGVFVTKKSYKGCAGTRTYFAPEQHTKEGYSPEPITVWQLGLVLFMMLHGRLPHSCKYEICNEEPKFRCNLSSDCKDFLKRCLIKTPEQRATMEALLHHRWLATQDSSEASGTLATIFEAMKARLRRVMRWRFG